MNDRPVKRLSEILDMASEVGGITTALDLIMENVGDSKGFRTACFALASLAKTRSKEVAMALDDYTTRYPERNPD